jgi:predicted protein tyrosine phosphatase
MVSKSKYCWRVPQGYVSIRYTPFCLKVFDYGQIVFWDRRVGHEVSMGQILEDMDTLSDREREALLQFLDDYPTNEEKVLYWCHGIQRTGRTLLKKYAKELELTILSKRLKEVSRDNSPQKRVAQYGSL